MSDDITPHFQEGLENRELLPLPGFASAVFFDAVEDPKALFVEPARVDVVPQGDVFGVDPKGLSEEAAFPDPNMLLFEPKVPNDVLVGADLGDPKSPGVAAGLVRSVLNTEVLDTPAAPLLAGRLLDGVLLNSPGPVLS